MSIGGGKGGIGKSLLAASLGWQLARLGKRVVLRETVDPDILGSLSGGLEFFDHLAWH